MVMDLLIGLGVLVLIFIISALPLHFAVLTLGGKTSLLKTLAIAFITGLIIAAIRSYFPLWGSLIAFLVLVWIYHEGFRLKWWKAFLVWFVQLLFVVLFWILAGLFLGAALLF